MNRLKHLNYDFWILLITIVFADLIMAVAFHKCFPTPRSMVVGTYFRLINLGINATVGPQHIFGTIALVSQYRQYRSPNLQSPKIQLLQSSHSSGGLMNQAEKEAEAHHQHDISHALEEKLMKRKKIITPLFVVPGLLVIPVGIVFLILDKFDIASPLILSVGIIFPVFYLVINSLNCRIEKEKNFQKKIENRIDIKFD